MGDVSILNNDVIQSNPLIEARKEMNLTEMRIFILGLQDIKPHIKDDTVHDLDFHPTLITYKELQYIFGDDFNGNITNLKKQIKKASKSVIEFSTKNGGFGFAGIYRKLVYEPNEGLIIHFNDELKPHILELVNKAYTKYKVKALFSLSSVYAWRILELLLEKQGFLKKGHNEVWANFSIEELRFYLNISDDKYKGRMDNFKRYILDNPIKEINEKTDYIVWYDANRKGKKIVGFKIWMKMKEKKALPAPMSEEEKLEQEAGQVKLIEPPEPETKPRGLSDKEEEGYYRLIKRGVYPKKAKELAKKYEYKIIDRNLKLAVSQKDTSTNLPGLIISMIEQDIAGQLAIAKQEAKERDEAKQFNRRQAYDTFHGTNLADIGRARADKGEERKEEAPPAQKELTELEANIIIQAGEKALKPVIEKMKKLGLTIEEVKAGKRK